MRFGLVMGSVLAPDGGRAVGVGSGVEEERARVRLIAHDQALIARESPLAVRDQALIACELPLTVRDQALIARELPFTTHDQAFVACE